MLTLWGYHRDRSSGARPNQRVFSSRCPLKICISWNAQLEKYRIESACLEHEGHLIISAEAYEACYRVKKYEGKLILMYHLNFVHLTASNSTACNVNWFFCFQYFFLGLLDARGPIWLYLRHFVLKKKSIRYQIKCLVQLFSPPFLSILNTRDFVIILF